MLPIASRQAGTSDAALMVRVSLGDSDAVADLYDRYAPIVLALARRILIDPDEAEDLLHHVFLEVMREADRYDPERGTVRAWLIAKARSRAIDRLRAKQRSKTMTACLNVDFNEHRAELADKIAVQRSLLQLPEQMRAVLALMYFEGRTASEVAIHLDVPIGTVKSRLSRATARLRGMLADN